MITSKCPEPYDHVSLLNYVTFYHAVTLNALHRYFRDQDFCVHMHHARPLPTHSHSHVSNNAIGPFPLSPFPPPEYSRLQLIETLPRLTPGWIPALPFVVRTEFPSCRPSYVDLMKPFIEAADPVPVLCDFRISGSL